MYADRIKEAIERAQVSEPVIEFIKRASVGGPRLGVFASSFNPVTTAHVELIRQAKDNFRLDEVLTLAGTTNADKQKYECPLEYRLEMLLLTFANEPCVSLGLSSSAFFVDMTDAIGRAYRPETKIYFIVGFDTFERVLDLEQKYTKRYHRKFKDRIEALKWLLERSYFIVAGRAGRRRDDLRRLIDSEAWMPADRIFYLDFPDNFAERSATEVRERVRAGLPITGLVPQAVERYIQERGLYK
jgi:nicotinate-nucleotide adenylyltransferase